MQKLEVGVCVFFWKSVFKNQSMVGWYFAAGLGGSTWFIETCQWIFSLFGGSRVYLEFYKWVLNQK